MKCVSVVIVKCNIIAVHCHPKTVSIKSKKELANADGVIVKNLNWMSMNFYNTFAMKFTDEQNKYRNIRNIAGLFFQVTIPHPRVRA